MDSTALTLPPYLVDRIKDILLRDVDIPRGLRRELQSTLDAAEVQPGELDAAHGNGLKQDVTDVSEGADGEKVKTDVAPPPTIEIEMVERLARWSTTAEGEKRIRKAKLGMWTMLSHTCKADTDRPRRLRFDILAGRHAGVHPSCQIGSVGIRP